MALAACGGSSKTSAPRRRIVVTETVIEILDPIAFFPGSADLDPATTAQIDEVARSMLGEYGAGRVVVQVRVPDDGSGPAARLDLAERRAKAVVDYLIDKNVDPGRLEAEGLPDPPAKLDSGVGFLVTEWNQ